MEVNIQENDTMEIYKFYKDIQKLLFGPYAITDKDPCSHRRIDHVALTICMLDNYERRTPWICKMIIFTFVNIDYEDP